MSKQSIKATIDAHIKQNGRLGITGQVTNSVLKQMVDGLGSEDEVVHKGGDETIAGLKTFQGGLETNGMEVMGDNTGISLNAESPFQERADQLVIEGSEGNSNILVERDPLVPLELATKQYVDRGILRIDQDAKIKDLFSSLIDLSKKVTIVTTIDGTENRCTIIPCPGSLVGWIFASGTDGWRKSANLSGFTLGNDTWWSELVTWMNNHATPIG